MKNIPVKLSSKECRICEMLRKKYRRDIFKSSRSIDESFTPMIHIFMFDEMIYSFSTEYNSAPDNAKDCDEKSVLKELYDIIDSRLKSKESILDLETIQYEK